ncbi:Cytochrome p450 [Thalictrum thalictroides]|uniref:Cytochrome p450 n=1 Tax=Thalictrum thalictroides TaxID=46969 RepID=A0A7J6X3Y0_THATH|nr:Cytochrome p450 [Thalictrum thalictroides]
MEFIFALLVWSGICLAVALFLITATKKNTQLDARKLPPGPPGWPIIGNLLDLGAMPHKSLASLSKTYGPVVWLRLGVVNTMVLSSAEAAMDMFKNHDLTFAGRNITEAMRACSYDEGSMALGQYGPYWRMLRRICTTELFTTSRINETEHLRLKCIDNMIRWMWDASLEQRSIQLSRFVSLMSFNVISNVMLSEDLVDPQTKGGDEFFTSISRTTEWGGKPNVADFFPFLQWLDPQRIKKNMTRDLRNALDFASAFVKKRILDRENNKRNTKRDFLDVLLDFRGNQKDGEPAAISEKNITIMILELFTASTDTTTSTVEWVITELLRNPSVMRTLQAELDKVVGQNKRVEESNTGDLHYLQAVVKETLRLHPPVPLLVPHRAMEDVKFMGYSVPKDTQILLNVGILPAEFIMCSVE